MISDDVSSLYSVSSHFASVADVVAQTSSMRVTFVGKVVHLMVCVYTCCCIVITLLFVNHRPLDMVSTASISAAPLQCILHSHI